MILRIFLGSDTFDELRRNVPPVGSCWQRLDEAKLLGNTRIVECDVNDALELLDRAKTACPAAVERISDAIHKSSLNFVLRH